MASYQELEEFVNSVHYAECDSEGHWDDEMPGSWCADVIMEDEDKEIADLLQKFNPPTTEETLDTSNPNDEAPSSDS
jgi:hypothetical protein